jgi:hypothetical protein
MVNYTPLPLYAWEKNKRYPLIWRLGGPHNRSGSFGKENPFALPEIKPRIIQSIALSLHRLRGVRHPKKIKAQKFRDSSKGKLLPRLEDSLTTG